MEVLTEAAVDVFALPSKTKTLESKSLIVADGFSSQSHVEALNDELMEDSHEDPVISPNSLKTLPELSCGDQGLVSLSSNSSGFSPISTSAPQSEETLTVSLPSSHIVSPGNYTSVPSQSNQDGSGSLLANGNEDGVLLDSDHRLVDSFDNDNREPDSPMPFAREKLASSSSDSKLADGGVEDEEEGFGDDDEKENPRRFFHHDPYYRPMYHHRGGHFNPEFHGYHPGLPPPWTRRFCRPPGPQSWNRWDDRERRRSQEYRLPGFMQEAGPTQQEDAHEFLQCLLERLERHCLDSSLTDDSSSSHDKNIVERVFGGRLVSKLRWCNCGHCSDKYEPLIDLSLEIENADTLQSALESFTKVEKIEDSETKFTCESCKEEVSREKQLILDQVPSVAALHLKRFKTDGTSVEKIGKHVHFPLELDLKPYTNDNEDSDVGFKYQLYAVVVHEGYSLMSGHYFCYIRSSPDTWHKLDDPEVSKEQGEFVLSQAAYILFYAREGTPWCSSLIKPQELCLDPSNSNTSPKSVLDNVNSECTGVANIKSSETNVIKDGIEATSTHIPCERKFEESDSRVETEGIFAQISPANGPNLHRIVSTGETPMVDVSVPLGVGDCLDGVLHDEMLCFPPPVEEDNCNQGAEKIEINGDLHPQTPPRSPTPDIGLPEARHHILRDHLKVENRVNCKRSSKKVTKDSQTAEALRCIKRMPTARGMKLIAAMLPRNDKIRPRSSPCKRANSPGSRCKPTMRMAVMR